MIYIDFPEYYPTENIQEDINLFIESGILVEYKVKETRAYAALEWTIPTAIVAYIVKPYFEAFLQEAGKQHFEILSKKLKTLINRGKQMNVRLISASKSTEKLNKAYNQSMAISIMFEIKNGKIIKLLFDNDLEKEDWDNAIDQILEFVIENYENENNNKLASIIKDFDNEKAFKIYALINKETKLVELYDDRSLMRKTREK
jgi:hypothetical protein